MARVSFAQVLALILALIGGASSPLQAATLAFDPGLKLARRSASPGCRASYALSDRESFCIPKELWLASRGDAEGEWEGGWKAYSPPENEPGAAKRDFLRFVARKRISPPRASLSFAARAVQRIERWREEVSEALEPRDSLGLLRCWLLGERSNAPGADLLPILGFSRFLSASGLQLYFLFWWISRSAFLPLRALRLPSAAAMGFSRGLGIAVAGIAWALAGLRDGMLRPFLMLGLRAVSASLGIRLRAGALFAAALVLELVCSSAPLATRVRIAVAIASAMLALEPGRKSMASRALALALGVGWPMAIGDAWARGGFAPFAPFSNAVVLPVFAGALYPLGVLAAIFRSGFMLSRLAGLTTALVHAMILAFSRASILWIVSRPALIAGGSLALLLRATCFEPHRRLRAGLALALLLALARGGAALAFREAADARASVEQLDVGQGDAALVLASGGAGLIDAGSARRGLSDSAWIGLLARRGVLRIDWVALTHLDEDHSGGVLRLARLLPVGCVVTSRAELTSDRGEKLARKLREEGVRVVDWSSPCCPEPSYAPSDQARGGRNANMSAVLVPLQGGGFYLSAGDAEARDEIAIGQWAAARMRELGRSSSVRILKLSHHGSRTSSDPELLRLFEPTEAWISVGLGNSYGHPAPEVLERVRALGIPVHRTDQEGVLGSAQRRSRPPSTTKTSPVTQAASSLRKKRIAPATSRGSPTRPSGKVAPRFA